MRRLFAVMLLVGCGGGASAESPTDAGVAAEETAPAPAVPSCTVGEIACGRACRDLTVDPRSCGGCGVACSGTDVCDLGACSSTCSGGRVACDGGCRDLTSDPANCGACGTRCEGVCSAGRCVGSCDVGEFRCGGACVDRRSDPRNCGACGHACAPGQTCSGGSCLAGCPTGYAACAEGCRALATDHESCGACGKACAPGEVCSAGACVASCGGGLSACSGGCHDLQSDGAHCGACGNACSGACVDGVCGAACPVGFASCSGTCRDLAHDAANCGACGKSCPAGLSCVSGACVCSGGATTCGSACKDLSVDPANCGACGKKCSAPASANATCGSGSCGYACKSGFFDCNGRADDGCETPSIGACTCTRSTFPASSKPCDPAAAIGGGAGKPGDPYLVCSLAHLTWLGVHLDAHFELRADLTFADSMSEEPLGEFNGVFDGKGHSISNVRIVPTVGATSAGLFARTGACAVIRDLQISGTLDCPTCAADVGLLAGRHAGLAERVRATGLVRARSAEHVGGLFGTVTGTLTRASANVTTQGAIAVGGLVGTLYGTLTEGAALGAVSGGLEIGGLVGHVRGVVNRSYARGAVTASAPGDGAGGLVGVLDAGTLADVLATGAVRGSTTRTGGLVGYAMSPASTLATIQRALAAATLVDVSGSPGPAFWGEGKPTIEGGYWYVTGSVAAQTYLGLSPVGGSTPADQASSYPGFAFPTVFRIPTSNSESPWPTALPVLSFRCDGTTVVCP